MEETTVKASIAVMNNGPYLVNGDILLSMQTITPNSQGGSWEWKEGEQFDSGTQYALCRCGQSSKKPFCDGTHSRVGFDGTETAAHGLYKDRAHTFEGQLLVLEDDQPLCAFARFCDNDGSVWKQIDLTDSPELEHLLEHEISHCPSGRLVLRHKESGEEIEPNLPFSIGVVEDPKERCSGPLWIRGGIPILSASGEQYEARNRATLCRCGASLNKPFCDGSHASIHFDDGLGDSSTADPSSAKVSRQG